MLNKNHLHIDFVYEYIALWNLKIPEIREIPEDFHPCNNVINNLIHSNRGVDILQLLTSKALTKNPSLCGGRETYPFHLSET